MSNLPKGWEEVKLGDFCDILDNQRIPISSEKRAEIKGNIPYYGANGVQDYINDFIFNETLVLLAEDGGNFNDYQTRPIAYMIHGKSWVNNHTHVLRAKNGENYFLFYSLVHKDITSFINGGTRTKLNRGELVKIPIFVPPLEEQKKIADILSTVDKKIAFVEENINATEELKKGLMQKLLTEGIGHTEFKDSELGRIPESWEIKSLSKVCNKVVDKNKDLLYVNVLTNSATLGIISQNEYFDREIVTEKNLVNYFVVNKFDYIYNPRISINAPCGPINQCKKYENGIVSPLYTVFRIEKDSINNDYLEFYFLSNHWNKYIKDNSNTGARHDRMSISDKLFFSMPIFIPPVEEQKQIAEILSTVDKKLENLKNKKLFFEELKKGLMQKLLTGEVRV